MKQYIFLLLFTISFFTLQSANPEIRVLRDVGNGTGVISQHGTDFGFFMPETGGYLYTGLICGDKSLWFHEAKKCKIEKQKNGWIVSISDPLLGKSELKMQVLPLSSSNGLILRLTGKDIPENMQFLWAYGGSTAKVEPSEKTCFLLPDQCKDNVFSTEINAFTVYYGLSMKLKVMMGVAPQGTEMRLSDAYKMISPIELWQSGKKTEAPILSAINALKTGESYYYCIYRQNQEADYSYEMLPDLFKKELTTKKTKENEEAHSTTSFGPDFHF